MSRRSVPDMSSPIIHAAINADDVGASRAFYERVLGWTASAWGPPGFYKLAGTGLPHAALQGRRDLGDLRVCGFECTVAVQDVDAAARAAVDAGGRVLMERSSIEGVGDLVWVADPGGNVLGLMRPVA